MVLPENHGRAVVQRGRIPVVCTQARRHYHAITEEPCPRASRLENHGRVVVHTQPWVGQVHSGSARCTVGRPGAQWFGWAHKRSMIFPLCAWAVVHACAGAALRHDHLSESCPAVGTQRWGIACIPTAGSVGARGRGSTLHAAPSCASAARPRAHARAFPHACRCGEGGKGRWRGREEEGREGGRERRGGRERGGREEAEREI